MREGPFWLYLMINQALSKKTLRIFRESWLNTLKNALEIAAYLLDIPQIYWDRKICLPSGHFDLTSPLLERNVLPVAQSLEVSAEITSSRAQNPKPGQNTYCRYLFLCLRLKTFH